MYRERPEPEPLQTWRDRVTLGKVFKWPMLVGAVALICRFAWRVHSGAFESGLRDLLDVLAAMLLVVSFLLGVMFGGAFVADNWRKPVSKWKRPFQ